MINYYVYRFGGQNILINKSLNDEFFELRNHIQAQKILQDLRIGRARGIFARMS